MDLTVDLSIYPPEIAQQIEEAQKMSDEIAADMAVINGLTNAKITRLRNLYPALDDSNTLLQAARFDKMRNRRDDLAMIALGAAEMYQETESHRKITLEAWNDAINGGIVLC